MGKRIMFRDADFSENGMKPIVNKNWAFGLVYERFDATKSVPLNFEGIAIYDAANCKNYDLTQHHITKIKYDAVEAGTIQILKIDKNDYTKYEVVQEIDCTIGNAQELDVDINIGSNHYLGVRNKYNPGIGRRPLYYFNEVGDYSAGMYFVMMNGSGMAYAFPNSVIRIDFLSETETWE